MAITTNNTGPREATLAVAAHMPLDAHPGRPIAFLIDEIEHGTQPCDCEECREALAQESTES